MTRPGAMRAARLRVCSDSSSKLIAEPDIVRSASSSVGRHVSQCEGSFSSSKLRSASTPSMVRFKSSVWSSHVVTASSSQKSPSEGSKSATPPRASRTLSEHVRSRIALAVTLPT